jgi:hypothetical protein
MSGPIIHKRAMEKMIGVAKVHMPVFWSCGSYWDNIEADWNKKLTSHGANLKSKPKNYGLLNSHIIPTVDLLIAGFKYMNEDPLVLYVSEDIDYDVLIRRLCHYCVDSFTIGQICGSIFWGTKDDKFDIAGELVRGSKNLHNNDISFAVNYVKLHQRHKDIMDIVVSRYYKDALKWGTVVTPREVTNMVRVAVVNGANLAASWVYYAWKEAGSPIINKPFTFRDLSNKLFDRTNKKEFKSSTFGLKG